MHHCIHPSPEIHKASSGLLEGGPDQGCGVNHIFLNAPNSSFTAGFGLRMSCIILMVDKLNKVAGTK